jgi:hypothetical protein
VKGRKRADEPPQRAREIRAHAIAARHDFERRDVRERREQRVAAGAQRERDPERPVGAMLEALPQRGGERQLDGHWRMDPDDGGALRTFGTFERKCERGQSSLSSPFA